MADLNSGLPGISDVASIEGPAQVGFGYATNPGVPPSARVAAGLLSGAGVLSSLALPAATPIGLLGGLLNYFGGYQDPANVTGNLAVNQGVLSGTTNQAWGDSSFYQTGAKNNYNYFNDAAQNNPNQTITTDGGFQAGPGDFIGTLSEEDLATEIGTNPDEYSTAVGGTGGGDGGGGGGGCFLTTAACEVLDKPDDCIELQTFRRVRDELLDHPIAKWLIRKYYREAPMKAELLRNHPNRAEISATMFNKYIPRVMVALEKGQTWKAILLYWSMSNYVKKGVL